MLKTKKTKDTARDKVHVDTDVMLRRKVLKNSISEMLKHIDYHKNLLISCAALVGKLDYENEEKYSATHFFIKHIKDKRFRVSYRFYVGIIEE